MKLIVSRKMPVQIRAEIAAIGSRRDRGDRLTMTERTAQVIKLDGGRVVSFGDLGAADGDPIMFCHSLPGSRLMPPFADELLRELGLRMIIPDRPGFGFSDFVPGRTVLDGARDVAAVADFLGLERFRLLATSSGCAYVLACCVAFPERVAHAGVVAGITQADQAGILQTAIPAPIHFLATRSRSVSRVLHALLIRGMKAAPDRAIEALGRTLSPTDRRVMDRPDAAQYVIDSSLEGARNGVRGWVYDDWLLNRPWGFSATEVPASVPVSLWWGDEDHAALPASGEELARQIPHATYELVEGCGHFGLMFERVRGLLVALSR